MRKNKKKIVFFRSVACVIVFLVLAFAILLFWVSSPVSSEKNSRSEKINVPSGASIRQVSHMLKEKGLIRSETIFYYASRFNLLGKDFTLKSGTYNITSSMSLPKIYEFLQSGSQEYITVTVPEGLTMSKIGLLLEESGVCSKDLFMLQGRNQSLLEKYDIPSESFEGYLFPDTYFFIQEMDEKEVICIMVDNFFSKIEKIENAKELTSQKLHDTVILASVVEREYRLKDEAPLISSVFTNRLKDGIGLYSCATIEYIITELEGKPHPDKITYDDLKIDSPYNTYKWAGLPRGPISNPGLVSLDAALNPAKTDYYFFVLTSPESGKHTFSKNFDQHKAAENTVYFSKGEAK